MAYVAVSDQLATGIKSLRSKLGWTQMRFARELGIESVRTISAWENGESPPSGDTLLKMLQMCPDGDSLREFGIDCSQFNKKPESADNQRKSGKAPLFENRAAIPKGRR